jgi:hypothetical protein
MKIVEDAIATSGDVWMGQPAYIEKVLGMKDAKSPVDG